MSVQTHPLSHGTNNQSSAFFIRHEVTEQEILFLGDVEPDSIAEEPRTVKVWQTAAPKIPHKLSTIFIECSWPSGRDDSLLYGHLNPEHLTDELAVLATEVVKLKHGGSQSTASSRPHRKRKKTNPITADDLRGALDGVRVFVIHCKHDVDSVEPIRTLIVEQVRALVEARGLGAEILAAEPGMSIRTLSPACSCVHRCTDDRMFWLFRNLTELDAMTYFIHILPAVYHDLPTPPKLLYI